MGPMYMYILTLTSYTMAVVLINPRRACAARVTVLGLCVSVCVCDDYSRATGYKTTI